MNTGTGRRHFWKYMRKLQEWLIPLVAGAVITFFTQQYSVSLKDQREYIRSLLPELTSEDPVRVDFALELIKESVSNSDYLKYREIIARKIKKTVEVAWSRENMNRSRSGQTTDDPRKVIDAYRKVRPEWKELIEQEVSARLKQERKSFDEARNKETPNGSTEFDKVIEIGNQRLDKKDCLGAFIAFSDAERIYRFSKVTEAGLTIAANCVPSEQRDALNSLIEKRANWITVIEAQDIAKQAHDVSKRLNEQARRNPPTAQLNQ